MKNIIFSQNKGNILIYLKGREKREKTIIKEIVSINKMWS